MKPLAILLTIVCLGLMAACGGGPAAVAEKPDPMDDQPIAAPKAVLVVHGMSCPLCATNLRKKLLEVPGVKDATSDLNTGDVTIVFADGPHPSKRQLREAVGKSGFSLKGFKLERIEEAK